MSTINFPDSIRTLHGAETIFSVGAMQNHCHISPLIFRFHEAFPEVGQGQAQMRLVIYLVISFAFRPEAMLQVTNSLQLTILTVQYLLRNS